MIPVTPLQGRAILVNADLIEEIESVPDTVIVLANGRRIFVTDAPADIVDRISHTRASVLAYADDMIDHGHAEVVPFPKSSSGSKQEGAQ